CASQHVLPADLDRRYWGPLAPRDLSFTLETPRSLYCSKDAAKCGNLPGVWSFTGFFARNGSRYIKARFRRPNIQTSNPDMADLTEAFHTALHLIATLDPELIGIVLLSLKVSLTAVAIASVIGFALGGTLAVYR